MDFRRISKTFQSYQGELYLHAERILDGIWLTPEPYAPRLQTKFDGRFRYDHVTEYNSKWLKLTKKGEPKGQDDYVPLEPLKVWTEDRWIFIRRMAGDGFCQKLFYKLCIFVWMANGIKGGSGLQAYQDALIEDVFNLMTK